MGDLHAIHGSVSFDAAAASALIAQLKGAATLLRTQEPRRTALAATARTDWSGVYATRFDAQMKVCVTDGRRLATALDLAAKQVEELAKLAQEEQERRDAAAKYERDLAAWKKRRKKRSGIDVVWGAVSAPFGNDDDAPVPPHGPKSQPRLTAAVPTPGARE